ncbi:hypothetical protein SDC9_211098 [bioreactor metagenome]|uniref:Uncharacterized protein n=1 Tax=bioreactor metagenome TaxID=1076179 RepID=A0A645JJP3_9ZZZZ
MFNHQQRITGISEPFQRFQQAVVITLMQADTWLIQNIEYADQPGANLSGQSDPLSFTARQCTRRTVKGQVVQADVDQKAKPGIDFF